MKKSIFVWGAVSGSIIIGSIILSLALGGAENENMAALEWVGYLIMIMAFSVIFIGIKRHRDQEQGGVISFGKAFLLGLGITAVASVIYVVAWEANLAITDYAFINEYAQSAIEAKRAAGASDAELAETVAEMEQMKENYGNPIFRLPITFLEIFPVGLLISLLSAAILRRSDVLPAARS